MKLLLLFIAVVLLVYRVAKWLQAGTSGAVGTQQPRNLNIDDVMLKDPICGTYFPRREAVTVEHGGEIHMFCSAACRDRFLEDQKRPSTH